MTLFCPFGAAVGLLVDLAILLAAAVSPAAGLGIETRIHLDKPLARRPEGTAFESARHGLQSLRKDPTCV